jgi:hypothetical protein
MDTNSALLKSSHASQHLTQRPAERYLSLCVPGEGQARGCHGPVRARDILGIMLHSILLKEAHYTLVPMLPRWYAENDLGAVAPAAAPLYVGTGGSLLLRKAGAHGHTPPAQNVSFPHCCGVPAALGGCVGGVGVPVVVEQ